MFIKKIPQRSDDLLEYEFINDVIIVYTFCNKDIFDFSGMPDGELQEVDTILQDNPIISAKKKDGILEVILYNYLDKDASYEERFPQWIEVS